MDRLIQIIRNLFIRLEGYFSVVFKSLLSFISNIFGFFAKLFGFTSSSYYLESNPAQTVNRVSEEKPNASETPGVTRRRSKGKVEDYYLNLARDVTKN